MKITVYFEIIKKYKSNKTHKKRSFYLCFSLIFKLKISPRKQVLLILRITYYYNFYFLKISGTCITGASTASSSPTLLGYALDGYPVYGYATTSSGTTLKSCWSTTASSPTLLSQFSYDSTGYANGTCHLDYANGYTFFFFFYGYVMVSTNYYILYYYAGTKKAQVCGFTP